MTLNNLVKLNETEKKYKKRKKEELEETKNDIISQKKICIREIECPICITNISEAESLTCDYCNYKWCKKCVTKSDYYFYNIQKNNNITYDLIKELITLQSCPNCRRFRCFKEEKNDSNFNSFKIKFINNMKYLSEDLYNNTEKKFKCKNCGIEKKSSKSIPQCNKCGLFNMMEL